MLDSLDTLIAFVLIFTVVSLLITIVVQMVTSLFNLRGANAAWGLAETFEAIAPKLKAETEGAAKKLADHLLKDGLISDCQIWGVRNRAGAVRADELFDLLHRIATGKKQSTPEGAGFPGNLLDLLHDTKPITPEDVQHQVYHLFKHLGVPDSAFTWTQATIQGATDALNGLNSAVQSLPADGDDNSKAARAAAVAALPASPNGLLSTGWKEELENALRSLPEGAVKQDVGQAIKTATGVVAGAVGIADRWFEWAGNNENAVKKVYHQFEQWFETGQERAQQWFQMHASWFTLGFAVVAALVLQLDTFDIFKSVSSNREMRDKLVAQTDNVLKQSKQTLGETKSVLDTALTAWRAGVKPQGEPAKKALAALTAESSDTRGALIAKADAALTGEDKKSEWLNALGVAIDKAAKDALTQQVADYREVTTTLDKTGFTLFPKNWFGRWEVKPAEATAPAAAAAKDQAAPAGDLHYAEHLPGIMCSILLLSLGAPFWFNLLKSLASLRSTVAGNISEEKKSDQKTGKVNEPGDPPASVMPLKSGHNPPPPPPPAPAPVAPEVQPAVEPPEADPAAAAKARPAARPKK